MAILHSKSRFNPMLEMEILSSEIGNVNQEGLAMTFAGYENGKAKIRPSNGTTDSIFAGFTYGVRFGAPARFPKIEAANVVADGGAAKIVLSKAPITGTILVLKNSTGWGTGAAMTEVTSGTPTNAEYKIQNVKELSTHGDNIGAQVFVVYQYEPTVLEARARYGDIYPGVAPHKVLGSLSIVISGQLWTDCYDTTKNWSDVDTIASGEKLKAGANGRITYGGSTNGADLSQQVTVLELPTVDQPFLGLWVKID